MREIRQKEAIDSFTDKLTGIIHCTPRFGKTKVGLAICSSESGRVLVAYPNKPIKKSWKEEIDKWGFNSKKIDFSTFLGLKKKLNGNYSLIILDEIHALSEAQIETLKEFRKDYPNIRILGLTGTLSLQTLQTLKSELNLSVCYKYTLDQAIEEGIVSDYKITVLTVPLDNSIPKYKDKKRNTWLTEKQEFDRISRLIDYLESRGRNTFFARLHRMRIIQNSTAKSNLTKKLITNVQPEKTLIFCGTTDVANSLGCPTFHSKSTGDNKLEEFCESEDGYLAVCRMLNMGITIKNLSRVIFNYFNSNEETLIQQLNRSMNYDYLGKIAKITIICSNEEVEKNWLKKAMKSLNQSKIDWLK